jgi:CarboxypepD_reg-like domain
MKKCILLVLIIHFNLIAYNQVIKGTVFDKSTKSTIYSAAVYINGTFIGTLTDQNGNFQLDISKYHSMPLTISAIGYYSATLADFSITKPILIYLNPKLFELNEVVVNAKFHSLERSENLTIFRNEFLGTTSNSLNCEITNENDIRFKYSQDKDTLRAFANKPILIDNKALGYKISYYLDEFEYDKLSKSFFFRGNIIFREDSSIKETKKQLFERRRKYAYLGSRMNFFRALWMNDLNSNGFTVKNSANETIGYNRIVTQKDNQTKYLNNSGILGISYYTKQPTSFIIFLKDKVYFDPSGYFDPLCISWEGEMARQRIADLLPYEYSPVIK